MGNVDYGASSSENVSNRPSKTRTRPQQISVGRLFAGLQVSAVSKHQRRDYPAQSRLSSPSKRPDDTFAFRRAHLFLWACSHESCHILSPTFSSLHQYIFGHNNGEEKTRDQDLREEPGRHRRSKYLLCGQRRLRRVIARRDSSTSPELVAPSIESPSCLDKFIGHPRKFKHISRPVAPSIESPSCLDKFTGHPRRFKHICRTCGSINRVTILLG